MSYLLISQRFYSEANESDTKIKSLVATLKDTDNLMRENLGTEKDYSSLTVQIALTKEEKRLKFWSILPDK